MSNHIPYMQGAEPFFQRGGTVGCLGLHGLTATPMELRWLGEHLAQNNITVYIPRLPGHGTHPRDLARVHWQDFFACALDGFHLLRGECEHVFVLGHSLGGLLALLLASEQPLSPDGVIGLGVPIKLDNPLIGLARWIKYVRPYLYLPDRTPFPGRLRAEQARRGETVRGRVRYDLWATQSVAEYYALTQRVWEILPQVSAPLLLIYSENDETVPLNQRDLIAGRVGSAVIEQQTLKESYHILPQDVEHQSVFDHVTAFMLRIAQQAGQAARR